MKKLLAILLFASSALAQTISSIEPASGPTTGGTFVHISGSDLLGLPLACPALACGNYVQFGETLGTISVNTEHEIVAVAPAHAVGAVDLIVNIAGKKMITVPAAFRYEDPADTVEQILLPIVLGNVAVPGAFGSMWKAEVTFHNASDEDVPIAAPNCNPILLIPCPPPLHVPPGATMTPTLYAMPNSPGVFVYVSRKVLNDVDISLRIQDVSRQAQSWGTSIPVVRAIDFRRTVRLNGVPTDSRFRILLRVYGYGPSDAITLRVFDPALLQPLVEKHFDSQLSTPSFLQIDPLANLPLAPPDRVRIEVGSGLGPPRPIWAFVSVTNNETQHVTVIAPSP